MNLRLILIVGLASLFFLINSVFAKGTLTPDASFLGTHRNERVGYHLHTAGDVNGDGYDDFLIGTFHNQTHGLDAGAAYLILGREEAGWKFNVLLDSADARFLGASAYDAAGYYLGGDGDINGDGYDDFLIGAPAGNDLVIENPGHLYVIFGKASADWGYDCILQSNANASFDGENQHDFAGLSSAVIGDINNDGYDDVICSSPYNDYGNENAGKVYLILGKPNGWSCNINLSEAEASFYGTDSIGLAGYSVDGVGDLNGDGIPDFAIGARGSSKVYLIFGRRNTDWGQNFCLDQADVVFYGEGTRDWTGWRVSKAGDVNADGYDDLLIGAPYHEWTRGKVYLIFGRESGWNSNLSEADASFIGEGSKDQAGWDVQDAGDVDKDGFDDFLIGAWYNDSNGEDSGKMYLIKGKNSGWQRNLSLSAIEDYFAGDNSIDYAGYSVSRAGDVNADGVMDIITSSTYNSDKSKWGGKISLFLNKAAELPPPELSVDIDTLDFFITETTLSFTIENSGEAVLEWNAFADSALSWVESVSPAEGELPGGMSQTVSVTINRTGLAEGNYSGAVNVTSNGGSEIVIVNMTIPGPPMLHVSPVTLDFDSVQNSMSFEVTNHGGGILDWQATENWTESWIISVEPASGALDLGQSQAVMVSIERSDLDDGDYSGIINVNSNGGSQDVTINMTVAPAPSYCRRINAGGSHSYTDSEGHQWSADQVYSPGGFGYVGGKAYSTGDRILGTNDQPLYQTERWGMSAYRFDVPNGTYQVVLHFTELYCTRINKRVMSVDIEGRRVLDGLDIYMEVGHDVALQYRYSDILVTDGCLDINFSASVDEPKISAIEVATISNEPVLSVTPDVMNFGLAEDTLSITIANLGTKTLNWSAAEYPEQTWIASLMPSGGSLAGGLSQDLTVVVDRSGLSQGDYTGIIDVSSNGGSKEVTLNMSVSGPPTLSVTPLILDFGSTTTSMTFTVENSGDGTLDWTADENPEQSWITSVSPGSGSLTSYQSLTVSVVIDRNGLDDGDYSGIISLSSNGGNRDLTINMTVEPAPSFCRRINAGGGSFTDNENRRWSADQRYSSGGFGYVGGKTYTTQDQISGTSDQALYQSERWGMSAYRFDLPNGTYQVVLHLAELYCKQIDKRVMSVDIEGQRVLDNFDIYKEIGHDIALQQSYTDILVTDGCMDIAFSATVDAPKISAIEVATVSSEPTLSVNPRVLDFQTNYTEMTFTVANNGGGTLNWTAVESPDETWLKLISPTSGILTGNTSQTVTVTVDRDGLSESTYTGNISITSNGGSKNVSVSIKMPGIIYVKHPVDSPNAWQDKGTVYNSITAAINAASANEQIWVAKGEYTENVVLINGISLYGGFNGNESFINERPDIGKNISKTIINGGNNGRCILTASNNIIDGFELKNGKDVWGGGIGIWENTNIEIRNMYIHSCTVGWAGGGIFIESRNQTGTILVERVVIWKCEAECGAFEATDLTGPTVIVRYCTIVGNSAYGLEIPYHDGVTLKNNEHDLYNNVVLNNRNPNRGVSMPQHNIWSWARSFSDYSYIGDEPWPAVPDQWDAPLPGNIFESEIGEPGFIEPDSGDFHLASTSACIGAGRDGDDIGAFQRSSTTTPKLSITPLSLDFGLTSTSLTCKVINIGAGTLSWNIDENHGLAWVSSITPSNGSLSEGASREVTVNVTRSGLSQGDYTGKIGISSNGGSKDVTVNMTVPGPPTLAVTPTTLDFGSTGTSMTFTVKNSGGGTLSWTAAENPEQTWITAIGPNSGSLSTGQSGTVSVVIDRSGLDDGDYSGIISISSNGGNQDAAINMTVDPEPSYCQRINAGGSSFTDSEDRRWSADQRYSSGGFGYVGGRTYTTKDQISGTDDQPLYQSERWGMSAYRFDVPNGTYQVVLLMAELYCTQINKRVMSVDIEGRRVLENFDIYKVTGHDVASKFTYTDIIVTDGRMNIAFSATVDAPKISAIEVVTISTEPVLAVSPTTLNFGLTSDTLSFTVSNSGTKTLSWSASEKPEQAWITSVTPSGGSLSGGAGRVVKVIVTRAGLSQGDYTGKIGITSNGGSKDVTVNMTVPGPPTLSVTPTTLDFGSTGTSMTFTVKNAGSGTLGWTAAENPDQTWITSISPDSGNLTSGQSGTVSVVIDRNGLDDGDYSGVISIASNGGNQDAAINMTVAPAPSYCQRINAGGSSFTDSEDRQWAADQLYSPGGFGYVGGKTYTTRDPISGTNDQPLYQSERWGMSAYRFDVPDGTYEVALLFAEVYFKQAGRRIFHLEIEGSRVLNDFDIFAEVGHDYANNRSFSVNVEDGQLDIDFISQRDDPKISAIQVICIGQAYLPKKNQDQTELALTKIPVTFKLYQNFPNPFNSSTTINYDLPYAAKVNLRIFNIMGQAVCLLGSDYKEAGIYSVAWNGQNEQGIQVTSGIYFYQIEIIPDGRDKQRISLVKKMFLNK